MPYLPAFGKYDLQKSSYIKTYLKFEKYFERIYDISCSQDKEYLFLTAWNEWGEGAYLEPDMRNGLAYLDAIKNIVNSY